MARILRVDNNFDHKVFKESACAFGVFDGVHRGHQYLLGCAKEAASQQGQRSIALSFDIDPDEMFHAERLQKIMSNGDRIACLASSGVDEVVILHFTKDFAALEPREFLKQTFNGCCPRSLHVGQGFRFGSCAKGTTEDLETWGRKGNIEIAIHDLKSADGIPISSTRIRLLLADGAIEEANELLGYPYYMRGQVVPGRGEGAELGFRTANLNIDPRMLILGKGVYAGYAEVAGYRYKAAISIGVSPTFADSATALCEAHILDYTGDLYSEALKIEILKYIRPLIRFESKEDLVETVLSNIKWVRTNI